MILLRTALAALCVACAAPVDAAERASNRPMRIVCPFPAVGGLDTVARVIAEKLGEQTSRPAVVDNRPEVLFNCFAARAAIHLILNVLSIPAVDLDLPLDSRIGLRCRGSVVRALRPEWERSANQSSGEPPAVLRRREPARTALASRARDGCGQGYRLIFSCKRSYFCPSCQQKRVLP